MLATWTMRLFLVLVWTMLSRRLESRRLGPFCREDNADGDQEGEALNVILGFERKDKWMKANTKSGLSDLR